MEKADLTSLWQPRQSCGSLTFSILIDPNPGFSALAGAIRVIEPGTFLLAAVKCGE
jgi:hypothetical protein